MKKKDDYRKSKKGKRSKLGDRETFGNEKTKLRNLWR